MKEEEEDNTAFKEFNRSIGVGDVERKGRWAVRRETSGLHDIWLVKEMKTLLELRRAVILLAFS